MSSYDALAASYDGLMADGVYRRRADYLEKLFRKSTIPVHTVLDLACGTGTIACLLAAKGYAVTATDLSEEMLTQAMSKAAALEQPPLFVQQSMPRLRLPEPVDAVVSTLDSLNYLTREKDIRETFRRVFRALKPGGSFFFDVNTPYKLHSMYRDGAFLKQLYQIVRTAAVHAVRHQAIITGGQCVIAAHFASSSAFSAFSRAKTRSYAPVP